MKSPRKIFGNGDRWTKVSGVTFIQICGNELEYMNWNMDIIMDRCYHDDGTIKVCRGRQISTVLGAC